MKNFKGFYCLGAASKADAQERKGLQIWSVEKPSAVKRCINKLLLGIYWIDDERESIDRGSLNNKDTTMSREMPVKKKYSKENCTCKH